MTLKERFKTVQRVEFIREACRGRKVLHLGCTDYPYTQKAIDNDMLLHIRLGEIASELYGFDADRAGLDILQDAGIDKLYKVDLERLGDLSLSETFDVIIGGEIIEHLSNPGLFLEGIKQFMRPDSKLVLTTVNAYCAMRFAIYGLRGKGGRNEPVHPDHVSYYSYKTLKLLLDRHRLQLDEFYFYDLGIEHRPFNRWVYNLLNDISVWVSPQLSDGIVAVARVR